MFQLKEKYNKEVIPQMKDRFGYSSTMAVPKIEKVVINIGFGRLTSGKTAKEQVKAYKDILEDLALIAGQKPVVTKAKKSIAGFKIREGMPVGAKITLRKGKMYDFLGRLINVTLPRSRDFRGISEKSFDKNGNLTIAVKEHIIFPEVSPERAQTIFSFGITMSTTANSREEGIALLKLLGFPIKV